MNSEGCQLTSSTLPLAAQAGLAVRWYVGCLERGLINACSTWGIAAGTSPHTGVWVGDEKIAAIGVQIARGVTLHGFALNCNTDMSWFSHIVPCGITDKGVTSLSRVLRRDVTIAEAAAPVSTAIADVLGASLVWGEAAETQVLVAAAALAQSSPESSV
jgi:lipoate-protein ligase B